MLIILYLALSACYIRYVHVLRSRLNVCLYCTQETPQQWTPPPPPQYVEFYAILLALWTLSVDSAKQFVLQIEYSWKASIIEQVYTCNSGVSA